MQGFRRMIRSQDWDAFLERVDVEVRNYLKQGCDSVRFYLPLPSPCIPDAAEPVSDMPMEPVLDMPMLELDLRHSCVVSWPRWLTHSQIRDVELLLRSMTTTRTFGPSVIDIATFRRLLETGEIRIGPVERMQMPYGPDSDPMLLPRSRRMGRQIARLKAEDPGVLDPELEPFLKRRCVLDSTLDADAHEERGDHVAIGARLSGRLCSLRARKFLATMK